ncbi:MAG: ferritin-like domain-containing protein [Myxococcota bacterium]
MTGFSLQWFGGSAERRFRRDRKPVEIDFALLDPADHPPEIVRAARAAWTYGAYQEYCTGAAFAAIQGALLQAGAPIDLIAVAAGFVEDEMLHAELNARVALALGGGISPPVDLAKVTPRTSGGPLEAALSLVVQTCCVGEAFSVPILAGTARAATHPVVRAVLKRIAKDEAAHASFGGWVLDWATPLLDDSLRRHLGEVASAALRRFERQRSELPLDRDHPSIAALGWLSASAWDQTAERAISELVVAPLEARGIPVETAGIP